MKNRGARGRVFLALITALLALTPAISARQEKTTPPAKALTPAANPATPVPASAQAENAAPVKSEKAPGGPQEGIKVHGHWMVEVRNADGSVASRHEFDNTLDPIGKAALTALLSRQGTASKWSIALITGTYNNFYYSTEPSPGATDSQQIFFNLTVSVPSAGDKLILNGSVKANQAGQLREVDSFLDYCSPDHAPGSCGLDPNKGGGKFTYANSPAINIQAGQTLNITVILGFS